MPRTGVFCMEFHDAGPDDQGRRHFSLTWYETGDPWPGQRDSGYPGLRFRAQCFFAVPEAYGGARPGIDDPV